MNKNVQFLSIDIAKASNGYVFINKKMTELRLSEIIPGKLYLCGEQVIIDNKDTRILEREKITHILNVSNHSHTYDKIKGKKDISNSISNFFDRMKRRNNVSNYIETIEEGDEEEKEIIIKHIPTSDTNNYYI